MSEPADQHDHGEPATATDAVDSVESALAVDLGAIERDLDGVAAALERLDAGTYWTDEATGEPIPDERLAADPVTRRAE